MVKNGLQRVDAGLKKAMLGRFVVIFLVKNSQTLFLRTFIITFIVCIFNFFLSYNTKDTVNHLNFVAEEGYSVTETS